MPSGRASRGPPSSRNSPAPHGRGRGGGGVWRQRGALGRRAHIDGFLRSEEAPGLLLLHPHGTLGEQRQQGHLHGLPRGRAVRFEQEQGISAGLSGAIGVICSDVADDAGGYPSPASGEGRWGSCFPARFSRTRPPRRRRRKVRLSPQRAGRGRAPINS